MFRVQKRMVSYVLVGTALLFLGACTASLPPLDPSFSLSGATPIDSSPAFRRVLNAERGTWAFERARIEYLLERLSQSPYNFIRNNVRYSGRRGEVHLRWKFLFRRRFQVKTAEDFINWVATGSKKTGHPYLIELPDKRRYPLRSLLLRELQILDQEIEKRRKIMVKSPEKLPA